MSIIQKWGLIGAVGLIVVQLIIYMGTSINSNIAKVIQLLCYVVAIGIVVFGCVEERKAKGGYLNYGNAFKTGFLISLLAAVVFSAFLYIYLKFINHDTMQRLHDMALDEIERQNQPEQNKEIGIKIAGLIATPGGSAFANLFAYTLLGVIVSLIIAAVVKRDGPPSFLNTNEPGPPANSQN